MFHHNHLEGTWWLTHVHNKTLAEPYEFNWKPNSVSFSYGNGHICDFQEADHKIHWTGHLETHLKHPTPHEPTEHEVIAALKSSHFYKIEHHKLHLFSAEHGKETMVFEKK